MTFNPNPETAVRHWGVSQTIEGCDGRSLSDAGRLLVEHRMIGHQPPGNKKCGV